MDLNPLICYKRRKKHGMGKKKDEKYNTQICDLPDPILQHIISSLPTKDAIRTCVLSKRWEHLWKGVSTLKLFGRAYGKRQQFKNFVRKLLLVCDCANLDKFSLSFIVGDDASEVNGWLSCFVNPKIQELRLWLVRMGEPLTLPDHLFTCSTLTKFELRMDNILKLPSSIFFQNLRALSLVFVTLPDSSSMQQILSGCPSLEELSLIYCNWMKAKAVCISSPMLRKLKIAESEVYDDESDEETDDDDDDDLEDDEDPILPSYCEVRINGTNLKSFIYDGVCTNYYSFGSSTSVINASIRAEVPENCDECDWEEGAGVFVLNLLKDLQNVEKLSISYTSLMAISSTPSSFGRLALFSNLSELHLVSSKISLACEGLLVIIHKSPCLQVIKFNGGVSLAKDQDYFYYSADPVPVLLKMPVKRIEINRFPGGYGGEEMELKAIKTLLRAAPVLETLRIRCDFAGSCLTVEERLKLFEKIRSFPKRSTDCEIVFENI